jgi:hypothetical protein
MLIVDHRLFLRRFEGSGPLTIHRLYNVFGLVNVVVIAGAPSISANMARYLSTLLGG